MFGTSWYTFEVLRWDSFSNARCCLSTVGGQNAAPEGARMLAKLGQRVTVWCQWEQNFLAVETKQAAISNASKSLPKISKGNIFDPQGKL